MIEAATKNFNSAPSLTSDGELSAIVGQGGTNIAGPVLDGILAFGLGCLFSSMIQVFVTRERIKESMGEAGGKSVTLGTFFGFISSSCSFAALAAMHYGFALAGLLPSPASATSVAERDFFALDYTFYLNAAFVALIGAFLAWKARTAGFRQSDAESFSERILRWLSAAAFLGCLVVLSSRSSRCPEMLGFELRCTGAKRLLRLHLLPFVRLLTIQPSSIRQGPAIALGAERHWEQLQP